MKLTKALKTKNRLAGEVKRLEAILSRENSRPTSSTSKVDRGEVYTRLLETTGELIEIKAAIARANGPIYSAISRMAELKSRIVFLQNLNTKDGVYQEAVGYAKEPTKVTYTAYLKREGVDEEVVNLQDRIASLQDEIDEYNAKTDVTV